MPLSPSGLAENRDHPHFLPSSYQSSPSTPSSPLLPIPTHALSPGQQGPFTADHTGRVSLVKTLISFAQQQHEISELVSSSAATTIYFRCCIYRSFLTLLKE